MKRHPALRDLSSDHHQALVQGHRLQKWDHADRAGRRKIVADFMTFWTQEGERHFCEEEQALLPYFARWGDLDQEPIRQMLREHALIRRNVQLIQENPQQSSEFYEAAGQLLEGHVRLEEREVFPLIEEALSAEALDGLPEALKRWEGQKSTSHQREEDVKQMPQQQAVASNAPGSNLPGANLQTHKMPGHWLLARLGKKVLRPGGLELTRLMLDELQITSNDDVVEFAPGMGATAEMTIKFEPASYTAVDRDEDAVARLCHKLNLKSCNFKVGTAEDNSLPDTSASVVYGEAMLTMQVENTKKKVISEAARLLKPGGRYGIHELCLLPDDLDDEKAEEICRALGTSIHVGARPLPVREWRTLLEEAGLEIIAEHRTPMHLLEPARMIADEGAAGAFKIMWNAMHDEEALSRIREMRSVFRKYQDNLGAISLVGMKR